MRSRLQQVLLLSSIVLSTGASSFADSPRVASRLLPWGGGKSQVGQPLTAFSNQSATALAVGPEGAVWLLDHVNARVARVDSEASQSASFDVDPDADLVAAGPSTSVAVLSRLRSRVWVHRQQGSVDIVDVPRTVQGIVDMSFGSDGTLFVRNAYQETYSLGRPEAPLPHRAILESKREGAFFLSDGRGVAMRLDQTGHPVLCLVAQTRPKPRVTGQHPLPYVAASARVVGGDGDHVGILLEQEANSPSPAIRMSQRLILVDAPTGRILWDHVLEGGSAAQAGLGIGGRSALIAIAERTSKGLLLSTIPLRSEHLTGQP